MDDEGREEYEKEEPANLFIITECKCSETYSIALYYHNRHVQICGAISNRRATRNRPVKSRGVFCFKVSVD